jgi:hypothetical protein
MVKNKIGKDLLINNLLLYNRTVHMYGKSKTKFSAATPDQQLYCALVKNKSRTLEPLAFDEKSNFDFLLSFS